MKMNPNMWTRALVMFGMTVTLSSCSGKGDVEEPASEPSTDAEEAAAPSEEETPAAEPAPEAAPAEEAPADVAPAPAEPAGFDGATVSRYVTSFALNVRTGPSKDSPVKRHVKWGDKIDVSVNGEWAKLAPGEYVSTNRLSEKAPTKKKAGKHKK